MNQMDSINENSCKVGNQSLDIMCKMSANLLSNSSSTSSSKQEHRQTSAARENHESIDRRMV